MCDLRVCACVCGPLFIAKSLFCFCSDDFTHISAFLAYRLFNLFLYIVFAPLARLRHLPRLKGGVPGLPGGRF